MFTRRSLSTSLVNAGKRLCEGEASPNYNVSPMNVIGLLCYLYESSGIRVQGVAGLGWTNSFIVQFIKPMMVQGDRVLCRSNNF